MGSYGGISTGVKLLVWYGTFDACM